MVRLEKVRVEPKATAGIARHTAKRIHEVAYLIDEGLQLIDSLRANEHQFDAQKVD